MTKKLILSVIVIFITITTFSQNVGSSPEYIKAITSLWRGERLADGRPKVSDELLERLKNVPIEAAWSVLRNRGYESQFEGS
jgi:4-hydroxy-4-methyl-2-oxoglutarate aldolase